MAKKFVEVTGLHNIFDVDSTGSSLNTEVLKESVSAKANSNSILFITTKDDSAYGYPDGQRYIWTRGKLFNSNNTSEGHIYDSTKDSLVEGVNTNYSINQATGVRSHAEGGNTTASGSSSHAEGSGSSVQLSSISSRTATKITFSALPSNIKIGSIIKDVNNVYVSVDDINTSTKTITVNSDISTTGNLYLILGVAYGESSHAEGGSVTASGSSSHAEGQNTIASGYTSHAEGAHTYARGSNSHAEGNGSVASGETSHAEGESTTASGDFSHAEGSGTTASGESSHAEGSGTTASGDFSHAEGAHTYARGSNSHAEGVSTRIFGSGEDSLNVRELTTSERDTIYGLTGKWYTYLDSNDCIPDGCFNIDLYDNEQFETQVSIITDSMYISIDGIINGDIFNTSTPIAKGEYWIQYDFNDESRVVEASGPASHAEGIDTHALGVGTHAEGESTTASGSSSHAEGYSTTASGLRSHAEGNSTTTLGDSSHAEGVGSSLRLSNIKSRTTTTITFSTLPDSIRIGSIIRDTNRVYVRVTNIDSVMNKVTVDSNLSTTGNLYLVRGIAYGSYSHAEGYYTTASGDYSHAEGNSTTASGSYSHAEGRSTTASGDHSHAEGNSTTASGSYSHAEGGNTTASGDYSHAEGRGISLSNALNSTCTIEMITDPTVLSYIQSSNLPYTHIVRDNSLPDKLLSSITLYSDYYYTTKVATIKTTKYLSILRAYAIEFTSTPPADGTYYYKYYSEASGAGSHAEGNYTTASGDYSHAEGDSVKSLGNYSHAEGNGSVASGETSHAEGNGSVALGFVSHAEGDSIALGITSHAEGANTVASGDYSHAEGASTVASGIRSHAEGYFTTTSRDYSHAEGWSTKAEGIASHAEGWSTTASGNYSHAEGSGSSSQLSSISSRTATTITFSQFQIGIKINSIIRDANGTCAKITNIDTSTKTITVDSNLSTTGNLYLVSGIACGESSHAEGNSTVAFGDYSHAEGNGSVASGFASHAEGESTTASGRYSHAEGWNTTAAGDYQHVQGKYNTPDTSKAFIIGGGYADNDRRNIMTVDWSGNVGISGVLSQSSDIRKKDVKSELDLQKCYNLINTCSTVMFEWKNDESHQQQIGVIAQEIKEFFPEIVREDSEGFLTVDYSKLTVICMRVLKDLIDRVSKLEA